LTTFAELAACVEGCRTEATASAGVATSQDGKQSLADMLSAADRALYEGKRRGRDSLRVASAMPLPAAAHSRAS
jgi:PleD family two-component response regulator